MQASENQKKRSKAIDTGEKIAYDVATGTKPGKQRYESRRE